MPDQDSRRIGARAVSPTTANVPTREQVKRAAKPVKTDGAIVARDLAVAAAMRRGRFEASGEARLVVLREAGLMIVYRTPFNPLPRFSEEMKFQATLNGKSGYLEPYGIEAWQEGRGKVLSVGWRNGRAPIVDGYEQGVWEQTLAELAEHDIDPGLCRNCTLAIASPRQQNLGDRNGHSRSRKRA